ncbi:MAG: DUF1156 domain-containing protein [Planctomycetota bacterium]|nr:DUF1156 domain-containing protein [Planctomycetota bacterium]
MTPPYRKKLIEVALPLEAINKESAREKSIRHGHPSTLHLWWARRPLAACRAVLFASLVDDPDSDPTFRKADGTVDEERAGARRAELFNLIEELVKWENSNNESILNRARAEIAACVASRKILDTKEWKKDQIVVQASSLPSGGTGNVPYPEAGRMPAPQAPNPQFIDPRSTPFVPPMSRGELPHLQKPGGTYFVTFRLADAVEGIVLQPSSLLSNTTGKMPAPQQKEGIVLQASSLLSNTAGKMPAPQEPQDIARRCETRLTLGSCELKNPDIARAVTDALHHFDNDRYYLHAWCIMPNHVHVVVTPLNAHDLSSILHSWKSFTAKQANRILARTGVFWERESFDHLCRKPEHVDWFVKYTQDNPVAAGLCAKPEDWPWSSCAAGSQPAHPTEDLVVQGPSLTSNTAGKMPAPQGATAWSFVCRTAPPWAVNAFLAEHAPPVLDPFCGGGSIPLEAQRLGLRAYASDLNPVPVLITKALIEIPPKFAGRPPVNPESRRQGTLVMQASSLRESRAGKMPAPQQEEGLVVQASSLPSNTAGRMPAPQWTGARGLAEDVRYYGKWMRDEAEKRIGHLYPKVKVTAEMAKDRPDLKPYVGEELTVIAWLWARTVASPNPAVGGAYVPLVSSFWLSTKKGKDAWLQPIVDGKNNTYRIKVRVGKPDDKAVVDAGTKIGRGCKFKCLLSDQPIPDTHIKDAGKDGKLGQRLLAIVAEGSRGRVYLSPTDLHEQTGTAVKIPDNISAIEAPLANDPRNLWCLGYGLDRFDKLFTTRQLTALVTLSDLVADARTKVLADAKIGGKLPDDNRPLDSSGTGPQAYSDAVATYLALGVSRLSDATSSLVRWKPSMDQAIGTFGRQAIPMVWDFAESNIFNGAAGDIETTLGTMIRVLHGLGRDLPGTVRQLDAAVSTTSCDAKPLICTDPPYYDNIGYADLSDFFYVWLRRSLSTVFPILCSTLVTPKAQELIATPYRHDGSTSAAHAFFEHGLARAFTRVRSESHLDSPFTIFYAFKQSEHAEDQEDSGTESIASTGWETMLEGVIRAGFSVDGTWPMRTELGNRMVGMGTNVLASSVVLSCRPRPTNASLATRREFLNALKRELPDALKHLQRGNIAPVDLAQAAIGPGMAVFTRYAKVMEADGSPMKVRQALALINQTLDEVLAEQEGEFDGDTRWALAWFEQFGMEDGPFGVAETLSKAKNTAINGLVEAGIVHSRAGKVRLLKRDEIVVQASSLRERRAGKMPAPQDWNPATDTRLRHWEIVQYLIRALETGGETAAADLLRKLGGMGETARDLAYRLYSICERKKWAADALAYNSLVIAWPEISKLARGVPQRPIERQGEMFL